MLCSSMPCESWPAVWTEPVRSKEIDPASPGAAGIDEIAVDVAAAAAELCAMMPMAPSPPVTTLPVCGIIDVAGVAAADGLQQRAMRAVAVGQDRAGDVEGQRARGAGAGRRDEIPADPTAGAAKALRDDADRIVASVTMSPDWL